MPLYYQVHHSIPQKYNILFASVGINIHETTYLRGVKRETHYKITSAWYDWEKSLDRNPTVEEVIDFSNKIDDKYGDHWYKP